MDRRASRGKASIVGGCFKWVSRLVDLSRWLLP